jgi:purine-nucleoside phosphorylase
MGLEPARKAARRLIEAESPRLLLSFGLAGALGSGLEVGDVVAGERCLMWENGSIGPAYPLASLPVAVHMSAAGATEACGAHYFRGTIMSVRVLQSIEAVSEEVTVVEMETVGIAQAAAEHRVPLASVRVVSDSPQEPIPFTACAEESTCTTLFLLLRQILRNPRILKQLLRLRRNSARAARNLAEAVNAILRHSELQSIAMN